MKETCHGRDHVKRGVGGYVDAEFVAQFLCLGKDPTTIPAGASIADLLRQHLVAGRLNAQQLEAAEQGLATLRQIEARMRLYEGQAISSLPTDAAKRLELHCSLRWL